MSEKSFIKHFLRIGTGTFISMFLGLITTPVITRTVSPETYGQFSIFNMYVSIAVMILCLGLDQALVRYYYVEDNIEYKSKLLFKCIVLPLLITVLLAKIFIFSIVSGTVKFEFSLNVVVLLHIQIVIQIIYRFSVLVVRLEYKSRLYSILTILSKLLYIGAALLLLYVIKYDYLYSLILATVTSSIVCLAFSIVFQRNIWQFHILNRSNNRISFRKIVTYGWPFIISMGITQLFQAMDKIFLNQFCSYSDVGIYSGAMILVNIFGLVQSTFNSLWGPMAVEHYEKDKEDRLFYQNGNQYITIIMFGLGFTLILVKDIFVYLLGASYREAAYILPFLIFNPVMYTISETTVQGIVFMKKSKMHILIGLVACIVNFIGNSFLVPILGCRGAAIATGCSYIVFFALRTYISNRYFFVNYQLEKIAIITFLAILYAGYNTFVKFNIITVILYVFSIAVLLILYKNHVKSGLANIVSFIKK